MYFSRSLSASTRYITLHKASNSRTCIKLQLYLVWYIQLHLPKIILLFAEKLLALPCREKHYPAYSGFERVWAQDDGEPSDMIFFQNAFKSEFCILPKCGTSQNTDTISWANHTIENLGQYLS